MRSSGITCAIVATCVVTAGHARAQEASGSPTPPALVPPKAIETGRVPYPAGEAGEASVVLELLVDKEGRVARVVVVDGREPFASAAAAHAARFRFEPARRADIAIAARIRMLVEFHEPSRAKELAAPPAPTTGVAKPAAADATEEVRVAGQRLDVGGTQMGGGEVRQMPGAFGDAFRAIDALPGVTPIVSGLPYYFIRGAPPGNTGYMIDGVRVPLLFHFGVARAVVHPGLIDRVDFYPGAFPARYGRFAGGIIDGKTKEPANELHGEWDASLIHAGALVEAPLADGRANVTVAGRYGYPGLLLTLLAPRVFLQYGDYQARASWKATDHDTLGVFTFGSYDAAGSRDRDGNLKDVTSTQFHRVDLRWDHDLGTSGRMRTAVTLGFDQTGNGNDFTVRDTMSGVRNEIDYRVSSTVRVRGGADVLLDHYTLVSTGNEIHNFPGRNDVAMGLRADVVVKLSPAVEIVPGARVDYFGSKTELAGTAAAVPTLDPRLATRVRVAPRVTLLSAFGITHQPPSFVAPVPGLQLGRLDRGVQTAVQISQGVEVILPAEVTITPTAFLHDYLKLTDATATCGLDHIDNASDCLDQRVRGRTFGLEVLLRRPLTKRLTGWVAYTLSRSTREAHPLDSGSPEQVQTVLSEFDRTHVLNVVTAYDLGRNWRIGGRFVYYTGRPYSNRIRGVAVPPFNSERLPPFFRIDARLEKRWLTKRGYIAFVAEGLNVTANKEVLDVTCVASKSSLYDQCQPNTSGSIPVIVPSIGLEGAF